MIRGVKDGEAYEFGGDLAVVNIAALIINRRVDIKLILKPSDIVVSSVSGCDVDAAGSSVSRHVVGEDNGTHTVDKGVASVHAFERLARMPRAERRVFEWSTRPCGSSVRFGTGEEGTRPFSRVNRAKLVGPSSVRGV